MIPRHMLLDEVNMKFEWIDLEDEMFGLMTELYPLCRSITGEGVAETIKILQKQIPLIKREVASGTKVYDWTVPDEWHIKSGWLKYKDSENHIVDFKNSNLHIMNYSRPIHEYLTYDEVVKHIHFIKEHPDWIPYLATYYNDNWGICMSYNQYLLLDKNKIYEVNIDTKLLKGSLSYGELYIPGSNQEEFLVSTYLCHPSLCNDNLSGVVVSAYLAKKLLTEKSLKYSYRFLFIPETIGAISWLALNEEKWKSIKHGLVATCLGDKNKFCYKKSRDGEKIIDKAVVQALKDLHFPFKIMNYYPGGSDERQYGSIGVNLPVGSLTRGLYVTDDIPPHPFKEYHSSADNLEFICKKSLNESLNAYLKTIYMVENNGHYLSLNQKCEPCLGKRNLYSLIGSPRSAVMRDVAIRYLMCYSDGKNDLLDIAAMIQVPFDSIYEAAEDLSSAGLIKLVE